METTNNSTLINYRRVPHAAHYENGSGHDLEEWVFKADHLNDIPNESVIIGAKYAYGFVDNGFQHWVFTKIAPFSSVSCERCKGVK